MLQNKKSLGQNWLKDRFTLEEIAESARSEVDFCVEIGPGLGTLTSSLLRRFPKVVAIEFDEKLAHNLPNSFPGKNLEVINTDVLDFDFDQLSGNFSVVGNIPYYITSPIIRKLLLLKKKPAKIVLLMQKEVADRILEEKGRYSFLTLFVQNYAEVEEGIFVERKLFTPPPKVDSTSVIFYPREKALVSEEVLKFVKQCFANPRKKLQGMLPHFTGRSREEIVRIFEKLGLDLDARPANLDLLEYEKLLNKIKEK